MTTWEPSSDRTPNDDVLDYAITTSLLITITLIGSLTTLGYPVIPVVISTSIIGGIVTFLIVPHVIAYWLDTPIQTLLNTTAEEKLSEIK